MFQCFKHILLFNAHKKFAISYYLHFMDETEIEVKKFAQGLKIRGGRTRIQTGSGDPNSLALSQLSHHLAKHLQNTSSSSSSSCYYMKTARRAVTEFGEYVCSGCAELTEEIPGALLSDTSHHHQGCREWGS